MSNIPADLRYSTEDEWVRIEGNIATIGITDFAQDSLSDIVYLELPEADDFFGIGETFGVVESVKAAADLVMPVSGTVTEINEELIDTPELVNGDPYGAAWMIKVELSETDSLNDLMDAAAYKENVDSR